MSNDPLCEKDIPKFPELSFDERSHIYKLNGIELPSVTTVMQPLSEAYYGGIDTATLAKAASRGTAVHQAIENYHKFGIIDIPDEYSGYFKAFLLWLKLTNPNIIATEGRVYHRILRYAGTADFICYTSDDVLTCIDFKASSQIVAMLVCVQLEAYVKAYDSHGIRFKAKQVVQLQADGNYKTEKYPDNDNEAWETFCGLLTVRNYLKKYGR